MCWCSDELFQSKVTSPMLGGIVVNSLLVHLMKYGVSCFLGYADVAIISRGKFGQTISGILDEALKLIALWYKNVDLSVNSSKTSRQCRQFL